MIRLENLAESDKGRKVIFTYSHGERVEGELSSWNDRYVFVRFKGPNGEACDPSMCEFSTGAAAEGDIPQSHDAYCREASGYPL